MSTFYPNEKNTKNSDIYTKLSKFTVENPRKNIATSVNK